MTDWGFSGRITYYYGWMDQSTWFSDIWGSTRVYTSEIKTFNLNVLYLDKNSSTTITSRQFHLYRNGVYVASSSGSYNFTNLQGGNYYFVVVVNTHVSSISRSGSITFTSPTYVVTDITSPPTSVNITSSVAGANQIKIFYTSVGDGISNYEYTLNDGTTFISLNSTTNPLIITNLIANTTYTLKLRALNVIGSSPWSNSTTATPFEIPTAPIIKNIINNNSKVLIKFNKSKSTEPISSYEYSINGGSYISFTPFQERNSDILFFTIPGFTNSIESNIKIRAITTSNVSGNESSEFYVYPDDEKDSSKNILLFDVISTNCDGAAYALFRLSSSYTGPTIQIRRSSDNATVDFYADPYGKFGTSLNGEGLSLESFLSTTSEQKNIKARYIRFYYGNGYNGNGRWMNLAGVNVYSSPYGPNIINSGMSVTTSDNGNMSVYPPSKMVDGDNSTFWHNSGVEYSWIMIDLGSEIPIYKIELINRQDCCSSRVGGIVMELKNNSNSVVFTSNLIKIKAQNPLTANYEEGHNGYLFYTFWPNINNSAYGSDSIPFPLVPINYKEMGYLIPYVTTWYDQSGQGRHATQTDLSLQPIFDFINKKIEFTSNIGSHFILPNNTVPVNSSYTITVKHGYINHINGSWLGAGSSENNGSNTFRRISNKYLNYWYSNDFSGYDNTYKPENIVTYLYDGNYSSLFVNESCQGVSSKRYNWNAQSINGKIGTNILYENLNGEIYYLFIFKKDLSQSDRKIIETGIPTSIKSKSISFSQLKNSMGISSNISYSKILKYNGRIQNSSINLSNVDGFILSNGLFMKIYVNQSHSNSLSFFDNNNPNYTGVTTNLGDIYSALGGFDSLINTEILINGSFIDGTEMPQVNPAENNPTNDIVQIPNPTHSKYVLRQTGYYTEYQINLGSEIQSNTTYVLSGWYSKSNDYVGEDTFFHCRAFSSSGNHIALESGLFNILETRVINGLTWQFCYTTITTPSDYNGLFQWYVGYGTSNTSGYRYYTRISMRKLLDAVEWYGMFYAPISGSYQFNLNSSNLSYLWIGDEALSGFTDSNALIKTSNLQQSTKTLTAGEYYPIRIQRFDGSSLNFSFSFTPPGGNRTFDGSGYFFCNSSHSSYNLIQNINLAYHYKFDTEDIIDTSLANWASGKLFDSTLYNGATISSSKYKTGTSSLFLNKNRSQYIQTSNFTPTTNGLTFSFWYRSNGTDSWGRIFDFGNGANSDNIGCSPDAGGSNSLFGFFCYYGSTGNVFYLNGNYDDNQWRHIVWTLTYSPEGNSTSNWKIYVNGSLNSTTTSYYPRVNITRTLCYIGKSNWADGYYNGYIDDFRIYNRVITDTEASQLSSTDVITYSMKKGNSIITTQIQGTIPSNPATSGYALHQSNPWLPNAYYWIKSPSMPNALQMYVDIKNGGFDYYKINNGISVSSVSSTHSGTSLGLELMIPRNQEHWKSIYNYIYNILGSDYPTYLPALPIYKTFDAGDYTSYAMFDPRYGNNGSYNGAPDWRCKDGGLWYIRHEPFGEPNGDYTANTFLGTYSIATYPQWKTSYQSSGFNDITNGYSTGSNYIVSTNYVGSISRPISLYNISIYYDGSTYERAAPSATYIKNLTATNTNGTYWINLPSVGPTLVYCIMDSDVDGGGWMMAMKAASTGSTFSYDSAYWTTTNTLNPTETNRNNGDAKFNTMNYFEGKDMMALWPDIPYNYNGGSGGNLSLSTYNNWCWLKNNFSSSRITLYNLFSNSSALSFGTAKGPERGTAFSSQGGNSFYGINFTASSYNWHMKVRWGFAWNNEYDWGTNDVIGGIGMSVNWNWIPTVSAGDWAGCCQDQTGINRQARVEVYVR